MTTIEDLHELCEGFFDAARQTSALARTVLRERLSEISFTPAQHAALVEAATPTLRHDLEKAEQQDELRGQIGHAFCDPPAKLAQVLTLLDHTITEISEGRDAGLDWRMTWERVAHLALGAGPILRDVVDNYRLILHPVPGPVADMLGKFEDYFIPAFAHLGHRVADEAGLSLDQHGKICKDTSQGMEHLYALPDDFHVAIVTGR